MTLPVKCTCNSRTEGGAQLSQRDRAAGCVSFG